MAVDFSRTFGAESNQNTGGSSNGANSGRANQPKAKLWLNIGYLAKGAGDDGSDRFVSLPVGIPVDTQEPVAANSRNANYAEFMAARNDLLTQIIAAGEQLAPGEDVELNLTIQLRRVSDERAPATVSENSAYARPTGMSLVAQPTGSVETE